MNTCPFCKNSFEYKDLLFFASRQNVGAARNADVRGKGYNKKDMNMGEFSGGRRAAREDALKQEAAAQNAEQAEPAEKSFIGHWGRDDQYEAYRSTFWKAEAERAEERYIVRWSEEKSEPGVAEVRTWNNDSKKEFPIVVKLSGKDTADTGTSAPGGLMDKAMCPHCHCAIPTSFLEIDDANCHSVALIGYPASGKTAFKLAIMDEFVRKLKQKFRLCQSVEIFADSEKFLDIEEKSFVGGNAESTAANACVFPMIVAIRQKEASHLITIYDLPGEAYRPAHSLALAAHMGIQTVDAAILLVDASQLYGAARADTMEVEVMNEKNEIELKEAHVDYPDSNTDITAPLEYLEKYRIGQNIRHMAMVVTKGDLLIGKCGKCFGEDPTLLKMLDICRSDESEAHTGAVSLPVLRQVDMQTMRAIGEVELYGGRDIKREICDMIYGDTLKPENISAFVVSTLRRPDNNDVRFVFIDDSGYNRHRIMEPMLYFMAKWGMVPSVNELKPRPIGGTEREDEEPKEKKRRFRLFGGRG